MFRLLARGLRGARDKTDVPGARQIVKTLEADARQGGSLRVGKDPLAGLNLDHIFAFNYQSKEWPMARRWPGFQRGPMVLYSWPSPPCSHYSCGVRAFNRVGIAIVGRKNPSSAVR